MLGSPFRNSGWLEAPYVVEWLANLGAQGRLPRELDFVHPGDPPDPLALPAPAVARQLIHDVLIAGQVVAAIFVEPERRVVRLERVDYWASDSARATLMNGHLDFRVFGLDPDLHLGLVYLNVYEVAAALGFALATPREMEAVSSSTADAQSQPEEAPRDPANANSNKRGAKAVKMPAAVAAMIRAVTTGKITRDRLAGMEQKELVQFFPAGRTLLTTAREEALRQIAANSDITPTKDK